MRLVVLARLRFYFIKKRHVTTYYIMQSHDVFDVDNGGGRSCFIVEGNAIGISVIIHPQVRVPTKQATLLQNQQ